MIYNLILSAICIILILLLFLTYKNILNIKKQLSNINSKETNEKVILNSPNRLVENMIVEINTLLENKQQHEITHNVKGKRLKEQISNMSHDLRTPLTSILGYIELLKDDSITESDKNSYLDIIYRKSKSLQGLINDFYDLSRLDGKDYKFNLESVNLYSTLSELIAIFYHDFESSKFNISVNIDESLPNIIADKCAIKRIYTNLIQNALKHGKSLISISQVACDGYIITTISNDCENINESDIEHVFDRFFTGDKMRSGQNTGIGLSIVKTFAHEMGHTVEAKIKENLFTITIKWNINPPSKY